MIEGAQSVDVGFESVFVEGNFDLMSEPADSVFERLAL